MNQGNIIWKNTDKIRRAIKNQSMDDIYHGLVELQDDMREYPVDDDAYDDTLQDIQDIIQAFDEEKQFIKDYDISTESLDSTPSNITSATADVIHRVRTLYGRHPVSATQATSEDTGTTKIEITDSTLEEVELGNTNTAGDNKPEQREIIIDDASITDASIANHGIFESNEFPKGYEQTLESLWELSDLIETDADSSTIVNQLNEVNAKLESIANVDIIDPSIPNIDLQDQSSDSGTKLSQTQKSDIRSWSRFCQQKLLGAL